MSRCALGRLVEALEELTPVAPDSSVDAGDVADSASAIFAAREPVIEELRQLVSGNPSVLDEAPQYRDRLRDVCQRGASWAAAMARSQHELAQRLQGCSRLRRYRRMNSYSV